MNGAEAIAKAIRQTGLKRVFTFPGGTIAPLLDALVKENIEIICARHEQGAGYMALAAARITQEPQVVLVTSGPGVTNLVTVIADAYFDSTPLIGITGQVGTGDLLSGRKVRQVGFQQIDTVACMKPIAKSVFQPTSPEEIPQLIKEAFALSTEGRHGPVIIDLPMDVQRGDIKEFTDTPIRDQTRIPSPSADLIEQAADIISSANRPVIFAGQGVLLSGATKELRELACRRNIPVVMSLLSIGAIPSHSPLSLGFIGHTGNQYGGLAVHHSDLLMVIGARLDVRQTGTRTDTFTPHGKIVRIDIDAAELQYSRIMTHLNIHTDAKTGLTMILNALDRRPQRDLTRWLETVNDWKIKYPLRFDKDSNFLKPQYIIETVNKLTSGKNVVVTSGVGSHQQWSARHFDFDFPSRIWLTSGGHGAMGYDLPSAIGAQLTRPDDHVICFAGDGSIQMNIQELQTVIDYKTPLKIFVLDNSRLALVSQFQLFNWQTDPTTGNKTNPDFAAVAASYKIKSFTLDKAEDVESVVSAALEHKGPVLVHCIIDYNEDVVPMLLAGQTIDKMWPYE